MIKNKPSTNISPQKRQLEKQKTKTLNCCQVSLSAFLSAPACFTPSFVLFFLVVHCSGFVSFCYQVFWVLQILLEICSLRMSLQLLKLSPHFYTDPVWRKEQAHNKEQQSTRNEGIQLHIFFPPPECKSWYFSYFVLPLQADLASRKLQNNWLQCQDAESTAYKAVAILSYHSWSFRLVNKVEISVI